MRTPDHRRLSGAELLRLRQALATEGDAVPRRTGFPRAAAAHIAAFLAICTTLWHGGPSIALSSGQRQAVAAARFVSLPGATAQPEQTSMKRMAIIGAVAALATDTGALAQNSGFARFSATSDTIRIQGNTVFGFGDYTYEARIRVATGSALGHIISEQRDSFEDKSIQLDSSGNYIMSGCNGGPTGDFRGTIAGLPMGEWMHFAYVHRGSAVYIYINGALVETRDHIGCYGDWADSWMSIGMFRYGAGYIPQGASPSFLGDLDWIRVSSSARYTSDFTPPFECEIRSDADTQLLLKFNELAGTPTLVDESPNLFVCDVGVPVAPGVTATAPMLGVIEGGYPACGAQCTSDVDQNQTTDGNDLAIILASWGGVPKGSPRADTNGDGVVDDLDLAAVLHAWGPCP